MTNFKFKKITPKELEELSGMPETTQAYYRCVDPSKIPPYYKIGKHVIYNESDVLSWIQSCRKGGEK